MLDKLAPLGGISRSPSSRRAWVEIRLTSARHLGQYVALLAEGVGRNADVNSLTQTDQIVALLAEGVGRNLKINCLVPWPMRVALLAEGVGRNSTGIVRALSPPCRPPRGGRG